MNISVIDTGIGISEEGINKLFIDFSKLDENSKRNAQGTGLGLSICKNIIEQMGGSVKVKSKLGEGSEFILNMNFKCNVKEMRHTDLIENVRDDPFDAKLKRVESVHCNARKTTIKRKDGIVFISKPLDQPEAKQCFAFDSSKSLFFSNL